MKRFILLIIICFINMISYSQNLDEKKEHLEELKEQIENQKEIIKKTEQNRIKTEKDREEFEEKKKDTDSKIKKLQKTEDAAEREVERNKADLNITGKKLSQTRTKSEEFDYLCALEFSRLYRAHYKGIISHEYEIDSKLISSLILQTANEKKEYDKQVSNLDNIKTNLEKKQKKDEKYYLDVKWSKTITQKKKKQYSQKVDKLENDIVMLQEEKKAAEKWKFELEREAKALDDLIAKLQAEIVAQDYSFQFSTPRLIWPVQGEILKYFGEQKSSSYNVTIFNNGIDIGVDKGAEVVSVEEGVVAFAERYGNSGKMVIIDHKNGFFSLYSHNSVLLVSKGDNVEKNQVIALSGSTGLVEQPVLHFELRKRGTPVNPLEYLE
ncbi:MAG: peptidoglycan DD-metalloendopeptidase family protein [Armatimonadetes bacterium]|nr:peptidoglycan DD-metalloendopeptidase family protein [Armatimonadota bacterium]